MIIILATTYLYQKYQGYSFELPEQVPTPAQDVLKGVGHAAIHLDTLLKIFPAISQLPPAKEVLSKNVVQLSESYIAIPVRYFRGKLVEVLPAVHTTFQHGLKSKVNWTFVAVASISEEIIFRYGIQTVLLTKAPKAFLEKVAPAYKSLVDHKVIKAVRVIFTSILFALAHIIRLGSTPGMLLPQFIFSIYTSSLREY